MSAIDDLRNALISHPAIKAVKDCPQVSVAVGQAMYGKIQSDGKGEVVKADASDGALARLLGFGGAPEDTTLWHFCTGPAVHHFVVIPAQNDERQWRYLVLMAYEKTDGPGGNPGYSVKQYVERTCNLSAGYKDSWTSSDLVVMLRALFSDRTTWGRYFLNGKDTEVKEITCYKYPGISVKKALQNLAKG
ncbi:MAG TPA: hypothetical protein VF453_09270 [Burkholderiaceae bacterium]